MQQMNKPYKGLFITFEGGEGSGKSTLCERLAVELTSRGYDVIKTREPGGTALSEKIREMVLDKKTPFLIRERAELLLFLAARAQHVEESILPALHAGKVVLCDRFNDSSVAYQGVARHLGKNYVEKLCQLATEGLSEPDCTFFLDIDPSVGSQRSLGAPDRMEEEGLQFHQEVRQGYLHLADEHPERIVVIDASLLPDEVFAQSVTALERHLTLKPSRL